MALYNQKSQLLTVSILHLAFFFIYLYIAINFWKIFCYDGLTICLENVSLPYLKLTFLSFFRPFFGMPLFIFAFMNGVSSSLYSAFIANMFCAFVSLLSVTLIAKILGKKFVGSWLSVNFPKTMSFIKAQDSKIILVARLIPFVPFDLLTLLFGFVEFKTRKIFFWSLLGYAVEAFILSLIGTSNAPFSYLFLAVLPMVLLFALLSFYLFFRFFKERKNDLIERFEKMKTELKKELNLTKSIVKREKKDSRKKPVLLLYGFFASRNVLTNLERILSDRGYEVYSFNLGGLFGVFFTRGIIETAYFLDKKLKALFDKYNFESVNIVAHSKGGLVALWWLQKLGGYKYCSKLITLGTPFRGTYWSWLGLITPLGFFFRDLWQMRPGSSLIKYVNNFVLPKDFKLYSFYSNKDKVVLGHQALLKNYHEVENIEVIPMHHIGHYGYIHRKDIGDTLVKILSSPYYDKYR